MSLAVLALAAGPVYLRSEAIERDRASDLAGQVLDGCRQRNSIQVRTRAKFDSLVDAFEELAPDEPKAIARLRQIVGTPQGEDLDCDDDGRLTHTDYTRYDIPDDLG